MISCDRCERAFEKQAHLDVHPCPAIHGEKKARSMRAFFDPAQRFLNEDD